MLKEITKLDSDLIKQIVEIRYLMQLEEINNQTGEKETLDKNTEEFINNYLGKKLYIFAYIIENKVISTASLIIHDYYPSYQNISGYKGTLSTVYTLKDYRSQGYQKQVLTTLINKAQTINLQTIRVNCNNPKAVQLYESLGFEQIDNSYKLDLQ